MQITINRMRELLFDKDSDYCRWNKKGSSSDCDPFLEEIFGFLDTDKETQKAYQQLLCTESSHDNFCSGRLRSDGYYPIKAVNEWIYSDLTAHKDHPDDSRTIQELCSSYRYLMEDRSSPLDEDSRIFTELLTAENCFDSRQMYLHLKGLLGRGEYLLVLAWLTVTAIFPKVTSVTEKRPDYAQLILKELFEDASAPAEAPSLHERYEDFLREKLLIDDELKEVIIVHNHGLRALTNKTRNDLLCKMIERAESVKILITEHEAAEDFTKHIRDEQVIYISNYLSPDLLWRDFCSRFPEKVTFRLSPMPAIHQYTEFRFSQPENTACFVGTYTYGNTAFDRSPFMEIPYSSAYFAVFRTEFEYLWSISHSYEESSGLHSEPSDAGISSETEFAEAGIARGAERIDFAFHAGAEWLMTDDKLDVISKVIEKKIPCRVIINDEEAVRDIIPHMKSANKAYVGLSQNIRQWREFSRQHKDLFQVRVSHIPLLHAVCHVKSHDSSSIRLIYYSYDNSAMQKNFAHIIRQDSAYYRLYENEYEYLWEQSEDISGDNMT